MPQLPVFGRNRELRFRGLFEVVCWRLKKALVRLDCHRKKTLDIALSMSTIRGLGKGNYALKQTRQKTAMRMEVQDV